MEYKLTITGKDTDTGSYNATLTTVLTLDVPAKVLHAVLAKIALMCAPDVPLSPQGD